MKLRVLYGRRRRGHRGSLKLGRLAIRAMSDDEFRRLLHRVRTGNSPSAWRQAKEVKRILVLMRRTSDQRDRRVIIKQGFRRSEVLDSLFPEREAVWLPSWQREIDASIDLTKFSFIDFPIETMGHLRSIADYEATCRTISINFDDEFCRDIGPYMVIGLLREKMLPVVLGGRIRRNIGKVIQAVHLDGYLRMTQLDRYGTDALWPFPLRQRRGRATSHYDDTAWAVTSEESVDTKLVDTVDEWLGALVPPHRLSETGRVNILTLIGEILDNAKRHSDLSEDGTWAIAGFMEARQRSGEDAQGVAHVCHLAIISPGQTIYNSLRRAPAQIQSQIAAFAQKHLPSWPAKKRYDEEALWTLSSLQDGISRVASTEESINGFGMMTLVEMINALGSSHRLDEQPRMTIISGNSCLMIKPPYNVPARSTGGHRVLALNAANDLQYTPDEDFVFTLPHRFPGTIVALRFCLDSNELIARSSKKK